MVHHFKILIVETILKVKDATANSGSPEIKSQNIILNKKAKHLRGYIHYDFTLYHF